MTPRVDAVILALCSVLDDAESFQVYNWETRTINRWINQLPGAWTWKWRHLKLRAHSSDRVVSRMDAIVHLRATIAYLEANRENIENSSFRWPKLRKEKMPALSEPPKIQYKIVEGSTSDAVH